MIPALYRDWNDEQRRNVGGFPCPARQLTRRASHYAGGARGMCTGPTSSNSYRYSLIQLTCGDPAGLLDNQWIVIPVPGAAPVMLEVERTGGFAPTPGYTAVDLVAAATAADIGTALAAVLDAHVALTSGRLRRIPTGASTIFLVARDPFVGNQKWHAITAGTPIVATRRFGAGPDHRDGWKVVRTGSHPHRRWVRCLVQAERDALEGQPQ